MRRAPVRLYGPAAGPRAADLGAVHLGERLPRGRDLGNSLQLVSVPGELVRSGALRVDARELERAAQRTDCALFGQAPQARVRGVRLRLRLQARARGPARGRSGLDHRPRHALAERLLPRQSLRMAGAGRRRKKTQHLLVLYSGARGARGLFARQRAGPGQREPYVQGKVPTWVSPIKDADGRWISSHVINQDIIAWVGQGTIADRSKESLGASDLGIVMIRRRLFEELDAVARGAEPKAVVRN